MLVCRLAWWPISWAIAGPSMTQDVYLARRAVDSQAALAGEAALRDALPETEWAARVWFGQETRVPIFV